MELPKALPSEFYGDNVRWFTALVIDSRPPEGKGLEGYVRIRIHGVHSPSLKDVAEGDLPWAQVLIPTTEGGNSGLGSTPRIEAGSLVIGLFMDGKYSQVPVVLGSLPVTTFPTPLQQGFDPIQPEIDNQPDVSSMNLDGVDNENSGNIDTATKERRQEETIKSFLESGYDLVTAITNTARLEVNSAMSTGTNPDGSFGIDAFSGERLDQLKQFSPDFQNFDTQVEFVKHELNTTRAQDKANLGNTIPSQSETLSKNAVQKKAIESKTYELSDKYGGG